MLYSIENLHVIICCVLISTASCPWGPEELIDLKALPTYSCLNKQSLEIKCRSRLGGRGCWVESGGEEENEVKQKPQETHYFAPAAELLFLFPMSQFFHLQNGASDFSSLSTRSYRNK